MEKAKIVIRSLDPSKNSAASETEINYLKNTLVDKEKVIKQLTVCKNEMRRLSLLLIERTFRLNSLVDYRKRMRS